jgi:hypothetical protein
MEQSSAWGTDSRLVCPDNLVLLCTGALHLNMNATDVSSFANTSFVYVEG